MRIPAWLQSWHSRLVQPPGSVVDLAELRATLPDDDGQPGGGSGEDEDRKASAQYI